ncbi:MAG: amidohydrolase family protein [Clostridioides sp.]|jgi:adenine deaminase|nr:amidohydrolase family protein [Clostridioides sp.]
MKIDLLLKNALVFNSYTKTFNSADVAVLDGKVLYVDKENKYEFESDEIVDCEGKHLIPGLVDIHMHIESSMTTPEFFCDKVASYGITTVVAEPHEITNVFGVHGVEEMIKAGKEAKIDVFMAIPSSVPSTSSELETTGGTVDFDAMVELSKCDGIVCVGEVMNYAQVIKEDNNLDITRFIKHIRKQDPQYIVEGHCPKLVDLDLAKFLYLGIDADHTEHNLEEIKQRYDMGMFVEIQDKMLKQEVLDYVIENNLYQHTSFVTDDTMADDFAFDGHLNKVVAGAIEKGFRLEDAVFCSTYTPSMRMNFRDRGTIAPGRLADMVLLESAEEMEVSKTFKNGKLIYEKGQEFLSNASYKFPEEFYNSIKIDKVKKEDFEIKVDISGSDNSNSNSAKNTVRCRVIEVNDGTINSNEVERDIPVVDGRLNWQDSDCLLIAVIERHGKNGNIGLGLVTGDILKEGAAATTYAHDHHNLIVTGKNLDDIVLACNTVIESQGGYVVCKDGEVMAQVRLPIAGILSDEPIDKLGRDIRHVREEMISLGYNHFNPILSLSMLGLVVNPELKISDMGLVRVKEGKVVDLIIS